MKPNRPITRRQFVRASTAGAAALFAAPLILPSRLFGADAPSNKIRVGQIGCGRIALGHDMPGVFRSGMADIVAVCDLDTRRIAVGKTRVQKFYGDAGLPVPVVATYSDY
jgi:hypothetical protein